ncbi:hypothetical protein PUN28_009260 [Cardiocondyla obscurior]|uniref:Uncharacterized protein n=1 Tax=Cardiocondyla obscurior TaxID=286306 RepID=A0AAW2FRN0_9HYME
MRHLFIPFLAPRSLYYLLVSRFSRLEFCADLRRFFFKSVFQKKKRYMNTYIAIINIIVIDIFLFYYRIIMIIIIILLYHISYILNVVLSVYFVVSRKRTIEIERDRKREKEEKKN